MQNFIYYNPVKIVFGKGTIPELAKLIPADQKVLLAYGGGSIKKNGVYEQCAAALEKHEVVEFSGIEPNPQYTMCMDGVALIKEQNIDFLLAVGGGSVLDTVKFMAAAALYDGAEPWEMMSDRGASIERVMPFGAVSTLPATGSEMNMAAVISRKETTEKCGMASPHLFPVFSILDPETTYSLPPRQTANGIVDAFVHVTEQYLTYPVHAPLQDRQAESILLTLIEDGPKALENPRDYEIRASMMWAAANALNALIGRGVPRDFATHMIGHELTALYGMDHARSLAVVLPGLLQHQRDRKREKLLKYAARVWDICEGAEDARVDQVIARTEEFFRSVGIPTRLSDYDIPADAVQKVAENQKKRKMLLGEHGDLGSKEIEEILRLRV